VLLEGQLYYSCFETVTSLHLIQLKYSKIHYLTVSVFSYCLKKPAHLHMNVTLRRVRVNIVVVEEQYVLHILSVGVCRLSYPTRKAHATYCHIWSGWLYHFFPHYLTKGRIFRKKSY